MSKYIHRAKTLPAIPMDYYARLDAFTSDDMVLSATNEVNVWRDQCARLGNFVPGTYGTNKPVYVEAAGGNYVQFVDTDKGLKGSYTGADLDANNLTIFMVFNVDKNAQSNTSATGSRTPGGFLVPRASSAATPPQIYHAKTGFVTPANDIDDRVSIFGGTVTHNGVNDNDVVVYLGDTSLGTGTTATDAQCTGVPSSFMLGNYADASSWTCEVRFHEMIIWDRVLNGTELGQVVDYLSNKWGASNQDAASEVISTASTAATWTNNNIDPDGEGTTNHPGKQTGEYSIVRVGDRDALYLDKNYPTATWGSNVKFWFDASDLTGSTVSSWTDRTGAFTANTTTSGDSAMSVGRDRYGKYVQGNGTDQALQSASVTFSTTATDQRLFWAVVKAGAKTTDNGICCVRGVYSAAFIEGSWTGDVYTGQPHLTAYDNSYVPVSVSDPRERPQILVWLQTCSGTNVDTRSWYHGIEMPTRTAIPHTYGPVVFGKLSTLYSDGNTYECGGVLGSAGAITDGQVDNLIHYLCEKYDVDYMPDTTPMDIGLQARSTATVAQTDCALWYRSDKGLSETAWALHPACAALHTTPKNFSMKAYTTGGSLTPNNSRKSIHFTESAGEGLVAATSYISTETTDFPADTNGCSGFHLVYHDSATTVSYGSFMQHYVAHTRFTTTSDTSIRHTPEGGGSADWTASVGNDKWALFGTVYHYNSDGSAGIGEAGTPDADPHTWYLCNDETVKEDDTGTATSLTEKCSVGCNTAGSNQGVSRAQEIIAFKHPLTATEISNLKRYMNWRYGLGLTP